MDAIVIGGGIIGLSIARELHKTGMRKIGVIEKGKLGREASWAAAGMLAPNAEAEKADDFHRFCCASNEIYPEFVNGLAEETGVAIDHRKCGTIEIALTESNAADLSEKFAVQTGLGFNAEWLNLQGIDRLEPKVTKAAIAGIHYPEDGYVDNRNLLEALTHYARINGIEIIENCAVESVTIQDEKIVDVTADGRTYEADITILATGAWSSLIKIGGRPLPWNVKPIKGQMIGFADASLALRKVIIAPGAYLTPRSEGRILVGATVEDVGFDREMTETAIEGLSKAAKRVLPVLDRHEISETWCGFRPFTADTLPIIGEIDGYEGLFVATAHYRNGILLAPLTAKIVAESIVKGTESPYFRSFGPSRFLKTTRAGTR